MGKKNTWRTVATLTLDQINNLDLGPMKTTWFAPNHKSTIAGRPVSRFVGVAGGYRYEVHTKNAKGTRYDV